MTTEMSKPAPILDVLGTHTITVTVQGWLHLYYHCNSRVYILSNKLNHFAEIKGKIYEIPV